MKYSEFLNELYSLQDLKYKEFHSKIILSNNVIGVRTPDIKRIAKAIAKDNYEEFFKYNKHELYEENMTHGLILGYLKVEPKVLKKYIEEFLPYIDNWAVCDGTVSNLKKYVKNKNKDLIFEDIKGYIRNSNPWINRFGYVMLLNYFIEEKYMDEVFKLCGSYKDEYYVKMAVAWLVSVCYVKYKGRTLTFLKNNILDDWTYNKSIQKIIESNRVGIDDKNMLRKMKRK